MPFIFVIVLILAGCSAVGPDYARPNLSMPPNWHNSRQGGLLPQSSPQLLSDWWKTLNDPDLTRLVELAIRGNLDLKTAKSKVRQSRAARGQTLATLFPAFNVQGSAVKTRTQKILDNRETTTLYSSGLDASWELDVFGGKRRALEAAEANLQGAEDGLRDVLVSLLPR